MKKNFRKIKVQNLTGVVVTLKPGVRDFHLPSGNFSLKTIDNRHPRFAAPSTVQMLQPEVELLRARKVQLDVGFEPVLGERRRELRVCRQHPATLSDVDPVVLGLQLPAAAGQREGEQGGVVVRQEGQDLGENFRREVVDVSLKIFGCHFRCQTSNSFDRLAARTSLERLLSIVTALPSAK